jgi:predicted ATP-dependent protease
MSKMSPDNIQKLIRQGRLVPVIKSMQNGKHYLIGYKRKGNSRKAKTDSYLLPQPEEITLPENFKI